MPLSRGNDCVYRHPLFWLDDPLPRTNDRLTAATPHYIAVEPPPAAHARIGQRDPQRSGGPLIAQHGLDAKLLPAKHNRVHRATDDELLYSFPEKRRLHRVERQ